MNDVHGWLLRYPTTGIGSLCHRRAPCAPARSVQQSLAEAGQAALRAIGGASLGSN
jgi:hypothetical protein